MRSAWLSAPASLCAGTLLLRKQVVVISASGIVFLATLSPAAFGQATKTAASADTDKRPQYECRWADSKIVIDGKPDDAAWKHAQVIDRFALPWLRENKRPPHTATKARLLWDRENLYFLAEMEDTD